MKWTTAAAICLISVIFYAQVDFSHQFTSTPPASVTEVQDIQSFDVDGDGENECIVHYAADFSNHVMQIYSPEGALIDEQLTTGDEGQLHQKLVRYEDAVLLVSVETLYTDEPHLMVNVSDYTSGALLGSHTLTHYDDSYLCPVQVYTIHTAELNDQLEIIVGVDNWGLTYRGASQSDAYIYRFDSQLSYVDLERHCGKEIMTTTTPGTYLCVGRCAVGYEQIQVVDAYSYLRELHTTPEVSSTLLQYHSGSYSYNNFEHYPHQYVLCNRNDPAYAQYGPVVQSLVQDASSFSTEYVCYSPDLATTSWTVPGSVPSYQPIIAATCVPVNDEDNYFIAFRGYQYQLIDRLDGHVANSGTVTIAPQWIAANAAAELQFITLDDQTQAISWYTLSHPIQLGVQPPVVPQSSSWIANYPNPFKPSAAGRGPDTEIRFQISDVSQLDHAEIEIYNAKGQIVNTIDVTLSLSKCYTGNGNSPSFDELRMTQAGSCFSVTWNGTDSHGKTLPSGIYFSRLAAGNRTLASSKMILMK
jgi:hypothetical protein